MRCCRCGGGKGRKGPPQCPVHRDLAVGFVNSLWDEHISKKDRAVAIFLDRQALPPLTIKVLEGQETLVLNAQDKRAAIDKLAADWRVPKPGMATVVAVITPQAKPPSLAKKVLSAVQEAVQDEATGYYSSEGSSTKQEPRKNKKGLLIGIDYTSTAAALKGCVNDAKLMERLLSDQLHWSKDSIRLMTDTATENLLLPTRSNIMRSLAWLAHGAQPGDSLFLYFSGHYAQVEDLFGIGEDGMNETIVPMDAHQKGMITDDQISDVLVKHLPAGVCLTVVMERGYKMLDLPFTWRSGQTWSEKRNPFYSQGDVQVFTYTPDPFNNDRGSVAARDQLVGVEGTHVFTSAFFKVVARKADLSYVDFMRELNNEVHDLAGGRPSNEESSEVIGLSSSHNFDMSQLFSLEDPKANSNVVLGRVIRQQLPSQPRPVEDKLQKYKPLGLGLAGGVAGYWMYQTYYDDYSGSGWRDVDHPPDGDGGFSFFDGGSWHHGDGGGGGGGGGGSWFGGGGDDGGGGGGGFFSGIGDVFGGIASGIGDFAHGVGDFAHDIGSGIGDMASGIGDSFGGGGGGGFDFGGDGGGGGGGGGGD